MKRANTLSTIMDDLTIKVKNKFTSSNAEKTNGFISPQMSHNFTLSPCLEKQIRAYSEELGDWKRHKPTGQKLREVETPRKNIRGQVGKKAEISGKNHTRTRFQARLLFVHLTNGQPKTQKV